MKILCSALSAVLFLAVAAQAVDPTVGVPFDLQGFMDKEVAAGNRRIVVPPGRYRVSPKNRQHLVLHNLQDTQIVADSVEMICTETTRALTVRGCTNVTVRGLAIDYDPLPFTQGRITGLSADKKIHEIELFNGYPAADTVRKFKYEIFRPDTRTLRCDDHYPKKVEVVDAQHIRVINPHCHADHPERVGDLIVIGAEYAPHGSIPHAIECSDNVNVRLEQVDLYASNCFGFLEYNCDGSTYYRCRIDRRPLESDLADRGDPRLRSLDADAFHSKHAVKGPAYIECTARFMGDDCINICGDYHMIMASQGRQLRVLAKHSMNIQSGDPVELVTYDGRRLPDAKVVTVERDGRISDQEREFLSKQRMNASLRRARGALDDAYTITLDREVDITQGSVICSANRIGNGFSVKDCTFGYNRSRGILIKASHGEVSGNHIEGCRMFGILVTPEYWWLEAGSSSDLQISGNTITGCGGIAICVQAPAGDGTVARAGAHEDIAIVGNSVKDCPQPGILVTSTHGLELKDNRLDLNAISKEVPGFLRGVGVKELKPVIEINCQR